MTKTTDDINSRTNNNKRKASTTSGSSIRRTLSSENITNRKKSRFTTLRSSRQHFRASSLHLKRSIRKSCTSLGSNPSTTLIQSQIINTLASNDNINDSTTSKDTKNLFKVTKYFDNDDNLKRLVENHQNLSKKVNTSLD
jgi:hypothetical protein